MRRVSLLAGLVLVLVPSFAARALDPADAGDDRARRAAVVAQIGPRAVTAGELEDRLATVPRFQLATFGATPDAIRRKFLDTIVVPEVLLALGAEERHLDRELPTVHQVDRALSNATLRAVRAQIGPAAAIPADEVKRYYDANRSRYDAPERINVWRILCRTRDEAQTVIDAAKKDLTVTTYDALARDHSIDKATYLRGGNVGFVGPDGTSNEAGLKVDPALVRAAATVKDGELVPAPVVEQVPGEGEPKEAFAVVWRRGTVAASHRSLDDVAAQIRDTLWKERKEAAEKKLIDDLRAREVKEVNEALLNGVDINLGDGSIQARRRPGQVPPIGAPIPKVPGTVTP